MRAGSRGLLLVAVLVGTTVSAGCLDRGETPECGVDGELCYIKEPEIVVTGAHADASPCEENATGNRSCLTVEVRVYHEEKDPLWTDRGAWSAADYRNDTRPKWYTAEAVEGPPEVPPNQTVNLSVLFDTVPEATLDVLEWDSPDRDYPIERRIPSDR